VADVGMAAVGRYASVYDERSAGSRRGRWPAGADAETGSCGRCDAVEVEGALVLSWLSGGPPGRLPMAGCGVVGGGSEGEGDLGGGGEDRSGASTGGSSTAVVLCEGVWLRDEAWVTVGETAAKVSSAATSSYRAH
jgi:hypothetical protein